MDKIQGTKPTILLVDEVFVASDYAKLERHLLAHGFGFLRAQLVDEGTVIDLESLDLKTMYQHPQLDQIPTGRIRKDNPQFQELPGVREMHAKAWGELLRKQFESPVEREQFKELTFLDRYSTRGTGKTLSQLAVLEHLWKPTVGADHPSRKREPKGPRGKWGKL